VNDEYTVIYWVSDYGIAIWIACFTESFSKTALNIIAMWHLTTVGAAGLNNYNQEQPRGNLPLKNLTLSTPQPSKPSQPSHLSSLISHHSSLISPLSSLNPLSCTPNLSLPPLATHASPPVALFYYIEHQSGNTSLSFKTHRNIKNKTPFTTNGEEQRID
jgi:hypothetical protein